MKNQIILAVILITFIYVKSTHGQEYKTRLMTFRDYLLKPFVDYFDDLFRLAKYWERRRSKHICIWKICSKPLYYRAPKTRKTDTKTTIEKPHKLFRFVG